MAKEYKKKSLEDYKKEIDTLVEYAEKQIEKQFNSPEEVKELMDFMSKFYKYSLNNTILIQNQFKGAEAVGSYAFWKEKGFQVQKGEKGIKILVPAKLGDRFENKDGELVLVSKASEKEKKLIKDGELKFFEGKTVFKQGYVFDISQTNAKFEDLPKIFPNRWLEGDVKDYKLLYKGMERIAESIGVKIIEPKNELGAAKGVSYPMTKEVALNHRNSELQNVKTLIHELAHANLHTMEKRDSYSVEAKEFQAELTAYIVNKHFGIDTSEYSFNYIKTWTKNKTLEDKEKLLKEVKEVSKKYIDILENTLSELNIKNQITVGDIVKVEDKKEKFLITNKIDEYKFEVNILQDKKVDITNLEIKTNIKEKYIDLGKSYSLDKNKIVEKLDKFKKEDLEKILEKKEFFKEHLDYKEPINDLYVSNKSQNKSISLDL